jgi:glycosyltransferase involved in cell wall biosynthesis
VLLANDSLNRGGLETLIVDLLVHVRASDHESQPHFVLLLEKGAGTMVGSLERIGQEIVTIERRRKFTLSYIFALRQFIRNNSFDLIHVHSPIIGFYLYLSSLGTGIPMVQTIHGFFDCRSPVGKKQHLHIFLSKVLAQFSAKTFCVSKFLLEELAKSGYPRAKLGVLYNGIDFTRLERASNETRSLWLQTSHNAYVFGMVGNFNWGRDHATLLHAFRDLSATNAKVRLHLAGAGVLRDRMIALARELGISGKVDFIGSVKDISSFLRGLDCFVYSSRSDTFGMAVIEALYVGLPVIVSDNGPFRETVGGLPGVDLFEAGNHDDLCERMVRCLRNEARIGDLTLARQAEVEARFGMKTHLNSLMTDYRAILES